MTPPKSACYTLQALSSKEIPDIPINSETVRQCSDGECYVSIVDGVAPAVLPGQPSAGRRSGVSILSLEHLQQWHVLEPLELLCAKYLDSIQDFNFNLDIQS